MTVPWQLKIASKLLLSQLPVGYESWRRVSLFRHGAMDDPTYALAVFDRHHAHAPAIRPGFVALELGPGDSVASALISHAYGASTTYLVDVSSFARRDLEPYRDLAAKLRDRGLPAPDIRMAESLEDVLAKCGGRYLTDGLASMRSIPNGSVDFAWSHAVLEHVERDQFDETVTELRRVLRQGGRSSHRIDLEDHLSGSCNHLRFTNHRWESPTFQRSGFYTNRLTCAEIVHACKRAGFSCKVDAERWDRLPVARDELAEPFRSLPDDQLRIRAVNLILTADRRDVSPTAG